MNVVGFNSGALNCFLELRGLGTFERVNKYTKFRPNEKFEEAIIKNGWAVWTNTKKTTFKFYEAFVDFINQEEVFKYYKEDLFKAKDIYNTILKSKKEKEQCECFPF